VSFLVYGMGEYKPRNNCKRMAPEFRDTPPVFFFRIGREGISHMELDEGLEVTDG